MIEFHGHRLSEDSISKSWPPTDRRIGQAFDAMGRLIESFVPLLESVKAAADSVAGCPATVYLLKGLFDGLRDGQTISGTLGSIERDHVLAFPVADRRLQLVAIGEDCGDVDKTLQMAAHLRECHRAIRDRLIRLHGIRIDDDQSFLLLAMGLYFSAGVPPRKIFENIRCFFSSGSGPTTANSRIGVSIEQLIGRLEESGLVSESIASSQIFPIELANEIAAGENRGELAQTLIELAKFTIWPNFTGTNFV